MLDHPILFLSRYIIENKAEYYETLAGVSQRGDWDSWLLYMLRAVESTARLSYRKINDIITAKQEITDILQSESGFARPEQLAEAIFVQPYTKVQHLVESGLYAENTARAYLNRLAELGILDKREIRGRHYYLNVELEQILAR